MSYYLKKFSRAPPALVSFLIALSKASPAQSPGEGVGMVPSARQAVPVPSGSPASLGGWVFLRVADLSAEGAALPSDPAPHLGNGDPISPTEQKQATCSPI